MRSVIKSNRGPVVPKAVLALSLNPIQPQHNGRWLVKVIAKVLSQYLKEADIYLKANVPVRSFALFHKKLLCRLLCTPDIIFRRWAMVSSLAYSLRLGDVESYISAVDGVRL